MIGSYYKIFSSTSTLSKISVSVVDVCVMDMQMLVIYQIPETTEYCCVTVSITPVEPNVINVVRDLNRKPGDNQSTMHLSLANVSIPSKIMKLCFITQTNDVKKQPLVLWLFSMFLGY